MVSSPGWLPIYCCWTPLKPEKFDTLRGLKDSCQWPQPRSGHRLVASISDLWLIGGYSPSPEHELGQLYQEVWQYNIATRLWRRVQTFGDIPVEMVSHAALLDGHNVVVHGGTATPFGERKTRQVRVLDLKSLHWVRLRCLPTDRDSRHLPDKVYGHSLTVIGPYDRHVPLTRSIYMFGGTGGFHYSNEVFELKFKHTVESQTWYWKRIPTCVDSVGQSLPTPRYRHEVVYYNRVLYVFGGGEASTVNELHVIPGLNIDNHTWHWFPTKPDISSRRYPPPRRCHCCLLKDHQMLLTGGCSASVHGNPSPYSDVWLLDMRNLQWRYLHELPFPVYFHAGAVNSVGQAFFFGGVVHERDDEGHVQVRRSNELFSCWLPGPPSLQELASQSVFALIRQKLCASQQTFPEILSELLLSGVPRSLLTERLPFSWVDSPA